MRGRFVVPAGWGQEAHCDEHSKKGSSAHGLPFGRISVRIVARAPRAVRSARDGVDSTEDRAGGERPTIDNIGAHRSPRLLIPRGGIVEEELVERTSGRRRVSEEGHGRHAIADYTQEFYGHRPDPEEQITVVLGASEGLAVAFRSLLDSG